MQRLFAVLAGVVTFLPALTRADDLARWQQHADHVTIIRDTWGVPHVYGKTDADAVFGLLYAQAEDDFNRVELNYVNALGRLAEIEGEKEIYRDLRMKLFIDPADLQAKYAESPVWLRSLMDAFADGLNFYLNTHPAVKPKLLTHFEPWMALAFSEGSIGGDIETCVTPRQLEEFYGPKTGKRLTVVETPLPHDSKGSNGFAIAPKNTTSGHALLLINPHTSFYFRPEVNVVSEEGLNAYGAVTWGQFFVYQGFNDRIGWMHTSGGGDVIDEYAETIVQKPNGLFYKYSGGERPLIAKKITLRYKSGTTTAEKIVTAYYSHHGPIIRGAGGKWIAVSAHAGTHEGAYAVLRPYESAHLCAVSRGDAAPDQLLEQHGLCRRRWQHRLLARQLHPAPQSSVRLDQTRRRKRSCDRVAGPAPSEGNHLALQSR